MRVRKSKAGLTVNVVAGTHVVFLGFDLTPAKRKGLRGFAIKRFDAEQGETVWLRGMKTFKDVAPHPALGETFATNLHPIQGFQWADYSAKPGIAYTYGIFAMYGDPAALASRIELTVQVTTESEWGATHSVFFNRGSVATQEYARRFQNRPPKDAGPGAYEWLSRGMFEAALAFIGRAGKGWEIHAAVYEFQWPAALAALRQAHLRGAQVTVLFDDIDGPSGPRKLNREAIAKANMTGLCKGRTNGRLMHNKFFVLSQGGKPVAVLTGSTNLTENGIFGHSNVVHVVEDAAIAQSYLDDWHRLDADPAVDAAYRAANMEATPSPPVPWRAATTVVFSPRGTDLGALAWYAALAGSARRALMMTFAFGMHEWFKNVYRLDDSILRIALMEKEGVPANLAQEKKDIGAIRRRPNVLVAIGNRIEMNSFDRWLAEMDKVHATRVNIYWIHTKYMLVDPLGALPIVVTGSANFSKASTDTNDENMLVIKGDKRVADIYFGEYLRLYNHYAFRESVKRYLDRVKGGSVDDWQPQFLETTDAWMTPYFDSKDASARCARRLYFAGPMSI